MKADWLFILFGAVLCADGIYLLFHQQRDVLGAVVLGAGLWSFWWATREEDT